MRKELQHISDWVSANNLKLNNVKSQEIIVHHPHKKRQLIYPNEIPASHVCTNYTYLLGDKLNILGITVSDTLTFHNHVDVIVEKTARSLNAIKTIRAHGLDRNALWDVTQATVVAQLLYASPACRRIKTPSGCGQKGSTVWVPFHPIRDELRQGLDETLLHSSMSFIGSYHDPKTQATTFVREPTT